MSAAERFAEVRSLISSLGVFRYGRYERPNAPKAMKLLDKLGDEYVELEATVERQREALGVIYGLATASTSTGTTLYDRIAHVAHAALSGGSPVCYGVTADGDAWVVSPYPGGSGGETKDSSSEPGAGTADEQVRPRVTGSDSLSAAGGETRTIAVDEQGHPLTREDWLKAGRAPEASE